HADHAGHADHAEHADHTEHAAPTALASAFSAILAKAAVTLRPRVWLAGPPGAVVANAIALPSIDQADIVISRTLLDRLTIEENVAIFSHEVAHLEHFTRARVMRMRIASCVFIVIGAFLVPLLTATTDAPQMETIIWPLTLAWLCVLVVGLLGRGVKVHGN